MRIGLEIAGPACTMGWHRLDVGVTTVGRASNCDLCIPQSKLDDLAFVLRRDGPRLSLHNRSDVGCAVMAGNVRRTINGTLRLADGDELLLGDNLVATVRFHGRSHASSHKSPVPTKTLNPSPTSNCDSERLECVLRVASDGKTSGPVNERGITIGSDPSCDLHISADRYISRFHALVFRHAEGFSIRDLGSHNGTKLGNSKVTEAALKLGEIACLGKTEVLLCIKDKNVSLSSEQPPTTEDYPPFTNGDHNVPQLIGTSAALGLVRQSIKRFSSNGAPVLLTGETGVGKEVVARHLHAYSPRQTKRFLAINCGGLRPELCHSLLFGHEKGAFTGANSRHIGAFEAASSGTLFLDEVGELPPDVQPLLLRALEEGEVQRLGSTTPTKVNVRLVAATNRDLVTAVQQGRFRDDLFHRLHVLPIHIPPLRARTEDIRDLCHYFLDNQATQDKNTSPALTVAALAHLKKHAWPGNIRELRNTLIRAMLLRGDEHIIDVNDIVFTPVLGDLTNADANPDRINSESRALSDIEREAIEFELLRCEGNRKEAAAALGISRSTLYRKLEEYGIDVNDLLVGHQ